MRNEKRKEIERYKNRTMEGSEVKRRDKRKEEARVKEY